MSTARASWSGAVAMAAFALLVMQALCFNVPIPFGNFNITKDPVNNLTDVDLNSNINVFGFGPSGNLGFQFGNGTANTAGGVGFNVANQNYGSNSTLDINRLKGINAGTDYNLGQYSLHCGLGNEGQCINDTASTIKQFIVRNQTAARENFKNRLKAGFDGTPLAVTNQTTTNDVNGQPASPIQQFPLSQAPLSQQSTPVTIGAPAAQSSSAPAVQVMGGKSKQVPDNGDSNAQAQKKAQASGAVADPNAPEWSQPHVPSAPQTPLTFGAESTNQGQELQPGFARKTTEKMVNKSPEQPPPSPQELPGAPSQPPSSRADFDSPARPTPPPLTARPTLYRPSQWYPNSATLAAMAVASSTTTPPTSTSTVSQPFVGQSNPTGVESQVSNREPTTSSPTPTSRAWDRLD